MTAAAPAELRRFKAWNRYTNAIIARQQGTVVPADILAALDQEYRDASDAEHALWLARIEARIAEDDAETVPSGCVTCGGSGWYWDQDLDGEHMRLTCTDCAAADRRVA